MHMGSAVHNPRIPYDLLRPIFEHLEENKASLCAISLASSACRDEGQRILFRKVNTLHRHTSHIKFLRTVAASPTRLALLVHAYTHSLDFKNVDLMNVTLNILQDGLKAMSHLKELKFSPTLNIDHWMPTYIQILSACTFSLERFEWTMSHRSIDDLVDRFLPRQTTLRHLRLTRVSFFSRLYSVPPATCPQLVSVTGTWNVVKALLPGRNILTVKILDAKIPTEADIHFLAAELKCVQALAIDLSCLWQMKHRLGLESMRYFSSLTTLKIRCDVRNGDYRVNFFSPDRQLPQLFVDFFERPEPLNMLSQLPVLQTLVLEGILPGYEDEDEDILELARHIFHKFSEHLRHIDIGKKYGFYSRYFRSQETVQKFSKDEVLSFWE